MPIYEYQCKKCGVFEVTQRITEPSLKKCPTCRGKVERIISATSFVLKGGGWYATDYARKPAGGDKPASSDSPAASPNGSTSATSVDSASKTSESGSKPAEKPSAAAAASSASDKPAAKPAD